MNLNTTIAFIAVLLFAPPEAIHAAENPAKVRIGFRILDVTSGKPTPAMICLRNRDDGGIRLPPDGRVMRQVSKTAAFYEGIAYDAKAPDWIGPVRKMNGRGDNSDRSFVYFNLPSLPHWKEPIAHMAKSRFGVELEPGNYRLSVCRGMEFVPIHKDFTVAPGKPPSMRFVWNVGLIWRRRDGTPVTSMCTIRHARSRTGSSCSPMPKRRT